MLSSKGRSIVIIKKGSRYAMTEDPVSGEHITILKCIVNLSDGPPPLMIFKLKTGPHNCGYICEVKQVGCGWTI